MAMVRPAGGGDGIVTTTAQRRKCAADPREGCAVTTNLIEPGELGRHRADPDWAIIDCRFELARPDWGEQAFAAAHIHNALYAHLDRDLSGPRTALTGRHPLPEVGALVATFGRWGIDDRVQVVAYDQGGAVAFAARLWWLLRWLGHGKVAVLDGGLAAWERAGLPLDSVTTARAPRRFRAAPAADAVVTSAALERLAGCGGSDRDVRLGRHGLSQSARARGRGTSRRAALRGVLERVDPRSGASGGSRPRGSRRCRGRGASRGGATKHSNFVSQHSYWTRNFDIRRRGRRSQERRQRQSQVQSRAALAGRGLARALPPARLGSGLLQRQSERSRGGAAGHDRAARDRSVRGRRGPAGP